MLGMGRGFPGAVWTHLFLSHGLTHTFLLHHEGLLQFQVLLMFPLGLLLPGLPLFLLLWTRVRYCGADAHPIPILGSAAPTAHQGTQSSPLSVPSRLLSQPQAELQAEAPLLTSFITSQTHAAQPPLLENPSMTPPHSTLQSPPPPSLPVMSELCGQTSRLHFLITLSPLLPTPV